MADADWDTVEGHGGFDVVMEEVVQWEQEDPAPNGRERIDDFHLAGSRTWRRRGGPFTPGGWPTQVAHAFDRHNASLSEGEPSLLWSGPCPESLMGQGLERIPRVGCNHRGGAAPGASRLARRAAPGGGEVEGATLYLSEKDLARIIA